MRNYAIKYGLYTALIPIGMLITAVVSMFFGVTEGIGYGIVLLLAGIGMITAGPFLLSIDALFDKDVISILESSLSGSHEQNFGYLILILDFVSIITFFIVGLIVGFVFWNLGKRRVKDLKAKNV